MRERFSFRVIEVADRALRNQLEGSLIATLAGCPVCGPSPVWLGRYAYSASMRRSGLWNTEFVGGPTLTSEQLETFRDLVDRTPVAQPNLEPASPHPVTSQVTKDRRGPDPARTLVVIPCSAGKEPGTDERGLGPGIVDYLPDDLGRRLSQARARVSPVAGTDNTRMAAWRRYGRGLLYRAAGASLEAGLERWPHILILSGAYGVVTAHEPIGNYGRQLHLQDWPPDLLQQVLSAYAAANEIEHVVGLAARTGDYRVLLRQTAWPESVQSASVYMPTHPRGVDAREATPRVMGAALAAMLDGDADLAGWRDPVYGSRLEMDRSTSPSQEPPGPRNDGPRISPAALAEVRDALQHYQTEVEAAPIADATKLTYALHSTNFVRWLAGRFTPGG
jgi:hypothetical protein